MTLAYSRALVAQGATDHNLPVVTIAGIRLVDVRARYRNVRPELDPRAVVGVSQHHDAVLYAGQEPGEHDSFGRELARLDAIYGHALRERYGCFPYHTVGFPSGRLFYTSDLGRWCAGVASRNHQLTAHCSAGLHMVAPPPIGTQLTAAMATIAHWGHLRRMVAVDGHRDFALPQYPTACPGDAHGLWVPRLPEAIVAIAKQLKKEL